MIVFYRAEPWADEQLYVRAIESVHRTVGIFCCRMIIRGGGGRVYDLLTGPNPEDFSFAVTVKQESCSIDDGRGYLWRDIAR